LELHNFIVAKNQNGLPLRNISKLRAVLGPYNSSFFAHDESAYLWMNIPPLLLKSLNERIKDGSWIDKPRIVALGCDQNFLLITEKNVAVWDLAQYRTLSTMLKFSKTQERGIQEVHVVILHAYRYQGFVAQSRNGTLIFENLPPDTMATLAMLRPSILQDTKVAEKKQLELRSRSFREGETKAGPSLNQHALLRREWNERRQQFTKESRGLRLSLSVSVSAAGIGFGKMVG
jgi:hypothetical protein